MNVPEFVRSAMDGFAVRSDETAGVGNYSPAEFAVIGESFPGRPAGVTVQPGSCVRIMTGAPLPAGSDAVVPVENTRKSPRGIEVTEPVPLGKNVGRVGEDIAAGEIVLPPGGDFVHRMLLLPHLSASKHFLSFSDHAFEFF